MFMQPHTSQNGRHCQCGRLQQWADDPTIPIRFDKLMNEYQIFFGSKQDCYLVMYFCLFCGGEAPESKRGDRIIEPEDSEIVKITKLMQCLTNIDDVIRLFGPPDLIEGTNYHEESAQRNNLLGISYIKSKYIYVSKWRTIALVIEESFDDKITYSFLAKHNDPSADIDAK